MIREYRGKRPQIAASAYVDPSAEVIGNVILGERTSVWCNTTIRADVCSVRIGDETNIQDNCCLHGDHDKPLTIGERVVVGHSVILHGCTVENDCLIGMGATILNGAYIGEGSIVAAGSLVLEGQTIPAESIVMGAPAKVRRRAGEAERLRIRRNAQNYVELSREYMKES
jgi:carbonic anhydrase/acetyltransferase-like protein (isoleucine patch superfamily)